MEINVKIPLIGIDRIEFKEKELYCESFSNYYQNQGEKKEAENGKKKDERIIELERALGNYFKFTGRLESLMDVLFPDPYKLPGLIASKEIKVEDDKLVPLFCYHLDNSLIREDKEMEYKRASAWANLMYDLGEFSLDEIFLNDIDDRIPHIYKFENNWYVWWANIPDAEDTIRKIWNRITGNEVQVIFVDDDASFAELFLGGENSELASVNLKDKKDWDPKNIDQRMIWLNPGTPYTGDEVRGKIDHIVEKSKKELLVFVIDLIFKKGEKCQESNVIKGDELIKHLRTIKKNVLVVGLTGGTSPFIINSAEKAGADIVVFKKRGDTPENIAGHSSGGNPVGIFDLLWAISWNVSVWRLLDAYKNNYINKKNKDFQNVAAKFFTDIDNASPFWKKYLDKWKTIINKEKIKRLFS